MKVVFSITSTGDEVSVDLPFLPVIGHAVSFPVNGEWVEVEYEITDVGYSLNADCVLEYVVVHVEPI